MRKHSLNNKDFLNVLLKNDLTSIMIRVDVKS